MTTEEELVQIEHKLRELLSETRGTLKDIKKEKKDIENLIKEQIKDKIEQELEASLAQFAIIMMDAVHKGEDKVYKRFDNLEKLLLGDGKRKTTMEELVIAVKVVKDFKKEE